MSLISSINMASGALSADDVGLQVVGQNIANANTPNYLRETVELSPGPTSDVGGLELGSGVQVDAVVQQVDNYLEARLRTSISDSSNASTQQSTYQSLEGVLGSLNSNSTSSQMTSFFSAISNVLNDPSDVSTRNQAVLQGQTLTENINQLASQIVAMRSDVNSQIVGTASGINGLVDQVASLNQQIVQLNGGNNANGTGGGLNDQRQQALQSLSQLINITTEIQPSGSVNVYCGGNLLVDGSSAQHVDVVLDGSQGLSAASLSMSSSDSPLDPTSGEVYGLTQARDQVLGGALTQLNDFAQTFVNEFNKVYASGQGLSGMTSATSEFAVDSPTAALNAASLTYTPTNGSFQVLVKDTTTGLTQTTNINVNLTGTGQQTSLTDLASQLNAVSGLSATITAGGQLQLSTTSANDQFAFANDTSGTLAALGINTFFTGTSALDMGVSQSVQQDPSLFAASQGGIGQDTQNAVALAGFGSTPLASQNGSSITDVYNNLINEVTQQSAVATSQADSTASIQQTLQGQETSISGVSLDEEAVNMMSYQQAFTASAKYITTLNQLFSVLVNI